jgi:hypothetical protein
MPAGALFFMHLTLNDGRRIQAPAIVTRCTWFGGDVSGHLLTLKF